METRCPGGHVRLRIPGGEVRGGGSGGTQAQASAEALVLLSRPLSPCQDGAEAAWRLGRAGKQHVRWKLAEVTAAAWRMPSWTERGRNEVQRCFVALH